MTTRLLDAFQRAFASVQYRHRDRTIGDRIAFEFFEDLYALGRNPVLCSGVDRQVLVVNSGNVVVGRRARRGDGTFGELIPGETAVTVQGYRVARGPVANVQIGVEVKILAKAMIKQIDRVCGDLRKQVEHFRRSDDRAIAVGIVGVNHSPSYTSYEGEREYPAKPSPAEEAEKAVRRLLDDAASAFDEFLVLRFSATNRSPYPFEWVAAADTRREYGAMLLRVNNQYARVFRPLRPV